MTLLLWALVWAATSCSFDRAIPKTKLINCRDGSACPQGYKCNDAQNLCQPVAPDGTFLDISPPQFAATADVPYLKVGARAHVLVTPNEPLLQTPLITAVWGKQRRPLTYERQLPSGAYQFVFEALAEDAEGRVGLLTDGIDLAGNEAREVALPVVLTIDFTPPTVDLAQTTVSPRSLRVQTPLSVRAAFSEPIRPGTTLEVLRGVGTVPLAELTEESNSGGVVSFTYLVPTGLADGAVQLNVQGVEDLAGNPLAGSGALPSFSVDMKRPVIGALHLQGKRYSAQPGFNQVHLVVDVDEPDATATVCVAGGRCLRSLHAGDPADFTVDTTYPGGAQPVSVSAVDAAGNLAVDVAETVVIDFDPPRLVGAPYVTSTPPADCPLSPAQVKTAGKGSALTAAFSVNEPLSSTVKVLAGALELLPQTSGTLSYGYSGVLSSSITSGTLTVQAQVSDVVGNAATLTLASLPVDVTPPAFDASKLTFARARWGTDATAGVPRFSLRGAAGAVESGAVVFALSSAVLSAGSTLGTSTASSVGAVPEFSLAEVDLPLIYAQAYDSACNAAGLTPVRVPNVEWYATLGRKAAGSTLANPNVFLEQRLTDGASELTPLDVEAPGRLARRDQQSLDSTPLPHFIELNHGGLQGSPLARNTAEMVFDSLRGRMVLFGGATGTSNDQGCLGDTWEWDGAGWAQMLPEGDVPMARHLHAMTYDAERQRVVLFGGAARNAAFAGLLSDTWEWNGARWTNAGASLGVVPRARRNHAMAYDPVRKRTVLFGGVDGANAILGDTWEWDGKAWTKLSPVGASPAPRASHRMVYDAQRARVLLYGGGTGASNQAASATFGAETWSWDGTGWTRLFTNTGPAERVEMALGYDSDRQRLVLHGGRGVATGVSMGDTWELNGLTWTMVADGQTGVSPRVTEASAYDSQQHRFTTFGGVLQTTNYKDTWGWDGASWSDLTPRPPVPGPRDGPTFAFDALRGKAVLFGGATLNGTEEDTWEWDGVAWALRRPQQKPPSRQFASMAWDSTRKRMVLFGGGVGGSARFSDTWEYDGANWSNRVSDAGVVPTARIRAAMAYDPVNQNVVMFGGRTSLVALGDTCRWDGTLWTCSTPVGSPPPQSDIAMAFDATRQRVVLIGTLPGPPAQVGTWDWDGAGWTERVPSGPRPPVVEFRTAAYDPVAAAVVVAGWQGTPSTMDDEWEWNGTTWTRRSAVVVKATARAGPALAYDTLRGRLMMFGGTSSPRMYGDLWEFDGSKWLDTTVTDPVPSMRASMSVAYDAQRERVVMFGGLAVTNTALDEVWEWDGASWRFVTPSGASPPARADATLVYDPVNQVSILFGGQRGGTLFNDLWEWNGVAWLQRTPMAPLPAPRRAHAAAWDVARNRMVITGGLVIGGVSVDDTWEWNRSSWSQPPKSGNWPSPRYRAAFAYDEARALSVMFGGRDATGFAADTWAWNGTGWTPLTPDVVGGALLGRARAAMVWNRTAQRLVLYGGESSPGMLSDTWAFDGTTWFNQTAPGVVPVARADHGLAFDAKRQQVTLFGGVSQANYVLLNDTWAQKLLPTNQVAHLFQGATGYLQLPAGAVVNQLTCSAVAGATGPNGAGVALQLWDGWTWKDSAVNADATPNDVSFSLAGKAIPADLGTAPYLSVRTVPRSLNSAVQSTTLSSDYVEMKVSYSVP